MLRDLSIPQEQTVQSPGADGSARPGSADPGHAAGFVNPAGADGSIPQEQTVQLGPDRQIRAMLRDLSIPQEQTVQSRRSRRFNLQELMRQGLWQKKIRTDEQRS